MEDGPKRVGELLNAEAVYRLRKLLRLMNMGIVDASSPITQIELIELFGSGVVWEDVTDVIDLPATMRGGTEDTSLVLTKEPLFKTGKIYAPRMQPMESVIETRKLLHNLNTGVDGTLILETINGASRFKRLIEICMVFWADNLRSAKETVTPRTITLEEVVTKTYRTVASQPLPVEITRVIQYYCNATHNIGDRLASDLVVKLEVTLPKYHELKLTVSTGAAVDTFLDTWLLMGCQHENTRNTPAMVQKGQHDQMDRSNGITNYKFKRLYDYINNELSKIFVQEIVKDSNSSKEYKGWI